MERILLLSLAVFLIGSLSFGAKSAKTKKSDTKIAYSNVKFKKHRE